MIGDYNKVIACFSLVYDSETVVCNLQTANVLSKAQMSYTWNLGGHFMSIQPQSGKWGQRFFLFFACE